MYAQLQSALILVPLSPPHSSSFLYNPQITPTPNYFMPGVRNRPFDNVMQLERHRPQHRVLRVLLAVEREDLELQPVEWVVAVAQDQHGERERLLPARSSVLGPHNLGSFRDGSYADLHVHISIGHVPTFGVHLVCSIDG